MSSLDLSLDICITIRPVNGCDYDSNHGAGLPLHTDYAICSVVLIMCNL